MPKSQVPPGYTIEALTTVSGVDVAQLDALKVHCDAEAGLDLKLSFVAGAGQRANTTGDADDVDVVVARRGRQIVGCCTLDGYAEIELCGMVAPEHRRHGLGRALLARARATCRRRRAGRVLLICEDGSTAGHAFLAAMEPEARLAFREHRMEVVGPHAPAVGIGHDQRRTLHGAGGTGGAAELEVRAVGQEALEAVARTQAIAFGDVVETVRQAIAQDMHERHYRYYLATRGGEPVSSLKVIFLEPRAYVYAFGVVPGERGRGIGSAVLGEVVHRLHAEGWPRVALEVETENAPALALYRRLGFRDVTTYGYYELSPH